MTPTGDLEYLQGLRDTALDFTMVNFYDAAILALIRETRGACAHLKCLQASEGGQTWTYTWQTCTDCGAQFDHQVIEDWRMIRDGVTPLPLTAPGTWIYSEYKHALQDLLVDGVPLEHARSWIRHRLNLPTEREAIWFHMFMGECQ
jgi:hypothetical protein